MADRREGNALPHLAEGRMKARTASLTRKLFGLVVGMVNWKTVEWLRPIAVATPKDLWRTAMVEFQIGAPPLYHRHSDRFGTTPSFHATTTRARYTEKSRASIRLLGVARPADDLTGEVTGGLAWS